MTGIVCTVCSLLGEGHLRTSNSLWHRDNSDLNVEYLVGMKTPKRSNNPIQSAVGFRNHIDLQ